MVVFIDVSLQRIYGKKRTPIAEREYLNEFHKQWNEACTKTNERMKSKRYSHEYVKAQSERLEALIKKQEEERKAKRKKKNS